MNRQASNSHMSDGESSENGDSQSNEGESFDRQVNIPKTRKLHKNLNSILSDGESSENGDSQSNEGESFDRQVNIHKNS